MMTIKEAIRILELYNPFLGGDDKKLFSEAIDVAIEALNNQFANPDKKVSAERQEGDLITSAQPELIEKAAYIRGFEQGRTQGMIDAQGGKK